MFRLTRFARTVPLAASVALVAAACGSSNEASLASPTAPPATAAPTAASPTAPPASAAPTTAAPATTAAAVQALPQLMVWDIASNNKVQLGNMLPADKPVLVWFWAPH